jgi:ATP-dependent RNA helicase DDX27
VTEDGEEVQVEDDEDQDASELDDEAMSVDGEDEGDEEEDGSESDAESVESATETARKDAFFAQDPSASADPTLPTSFSSMNLSRPLLRALSSLQFSTPTPIQARAVPLALLGRDILGSAVTGSGKTGAFMIPILERLTYRDRGKGGQACRVLVLCPTRELAVQCEAVGKALAEKGGLDVRFALLVGGLSLNAQAHTLRTLPDVLIATPGRLIDHLTNTPSFTLSALDVLVIDEADRMLEAGFTDELEEIIKACPRSRQTMLFSATMTDSVDELVKLSLDRPIRVFVDPKRNTAQGLTQEFVRIRSDDSRSPSLLALCKRTVREKCIIFFRSKALAHQMRVVFGLCGLKAAELHGNLTQEQVGFCACDEANGSVCKRSTTSRPIGWITSWQLISPRVVSISREWRRSSTMTCRVSWRNTPTESVVQPEPGGRDGGSCGGDAVDISDRFRWLARQIGRCSRLRSSRHRPTRSVTGSSLPRRSPPCRAAWTSSRMKSKRFLRRSARRR